MIDILQAAILVGIGIWSAHSAGSSIQEGKFGAAFVSAWFAVGMLSFLVVMAVQNGGLS